MAKIKLGGYLPDPPSDAYWSFEDKLKPLLGSSTSGSVDLRQYSSPRHNQTTTNSCVAQSMVKALEIKRLMAGKDHVDLSVLFLYFMCRQRMNPPQTDKDEGTYIWMAADCIRKLGVCPEELWVFDKKKIYLNPGWNVLRAGAVNKIKAAYKIMGRGPDRVNEAIRALHAGNPVVYGTETGQNWLDYRKGQVLGHVQGQVYGGHATVLVGWTGSVFIGENSWGSSWGNNGFYEIEPDVFGSSASNDPWVIEGGFESWSERQVGG